MSTIKEFRRITVSGIARVVSQRTILVATELLGHLTIPSPFN